MKFRKPLLYNTYPITSHRNVHRILPLLSSLSTPTPTFTHTSSAVALSIANFEKILQSTRWTRWIQQFNKLNSKRNHHQVYQNQVRNQVQIVQSIGRENQYQLNVHQGNQLNLPSRVINRPRLSYHSHTRALRAPYLQPPTHSFLQPPLNLTAYNEYILTVIRQVLKTDGPRPSRLSVGLSVFLGDSQSD